MNKAIKTISSVAIMLFCTGSMALLSMPTYAYECENNYQADFNTCTTVSPQAHTIDVVSEYLINSVIEETDDMNYYLSNRIDYYSNSEGVSDSNYCFLINDNEIVSTVNSYKYNGRSYVVVEDYVPHDIQEIYDSQQTISEALISSHNLSGIKIEKTIFDDVALYNQNTIIKKQIQLPLAEKMLAPLATSSSINTFIISNVKYVRNEKINGRYVCWAACIAMKHNYINDSTFTANSVYTKVGNPGDVYPEDEVQFYKTSPFNISVTLKNDCLTNSEILSALKKQTKSSPKVKNNPIEIIADDMNNSSISHAMMMYGIQIYVDHTDYYFFDPDMNSTSGKPSSGKAYISIQGNPDETHDKFYYVTSYNNHNYHWKKTIY